MEEFSKNRSIRVECRNINENGIGTCQMEIPSSNQWVSCCPFGHASIRNGRCKSLFKSYNSFYAFFNPAVTLRIYPHFLGKWNDNDMETIFYFLSNFQYSKWNAIRYYILNQWDSTQGYVSDLFWAVKKSQEHTMISHDANNSGKVLSLKDIHNFVKIQRKSNVLSSSGIYVILVNEYNKNSKRDSWEKILHLKSIVKLFVDITPICHPI